MYVPDPRSKHNQRKGNRTPTGTASTAKKHEIAKINICGSQCYDTSTPEGGGASRPSDIDDNRYFLMAGQNSLLLKLERISPSVRYVSCLLDHTTKPVE